MKLSRRKFLETTSLACGAAWICGCNSAPITGRKRVLLIPENQELTLGAKAFDESLAEQKPSSNSRLTQVVERVGKRIASVSGRQDFQWDFRLIENTTPNAFCLPGGKVAVHTGILPICQNEAGLAVVMGHEIAHALARHGGERMSQNLWMDGAQVLAGKVIANKFPSRQEQLMKYYGLGSKYLVQLPYSRLQESEADHIGIMLMAKAGYNPTGAPAFWQRFAGSTNSPETLEWFSTHPSDARRSQDLLELMDEAKSLYQKAPQRFETGERLI